MDPDPSPIQDMIATDDGKYLFTSAGTGVLVWDLRKWVWVFVIGAECWRGFMSVCVCVWVWVCGCVCVCVCVCVSELIVVVVTLHGYTVTLISSSLLSPFLCISSPYSIFILLPSPPFDPSSLHSPSSPQDSLCWSAGWPQRCCAVSRPRP